MEENIKEPIEDIFANYMINENHQWLNNITQRKCENLFLKLKLHNNKVDVLKAELYKNINQVTKELNKIGLNNHFYNKLISNLYFINIQEIKQITFSYPYFNPKEYLFKEFIIIHTIYSSIFQNYFEQLYIYELYQLPKDTKKYTSFFTSQHYIDNEDELQEYYQTILYECFDLFQTLDRNPFQKNIEKVVNKMVKINSHIIIIGYINRCLIEDNFTFKDFQNTFPSIFNDKITKLIPKRIDEFNYKKINKIINSYKWKANKQNSLEPIYKNLEPLLKDTTYKQFKNVFSNKDIKKIKPIKINLDASELIFLLLQLMDYNYIDTESNFNLKRLRACFKKKDGTEFIENISSLKKQIKENTILTIEKRNKINNLLKID